MRYGSRYGGLFRQNRAWEPAAQGAVYTGPTVTENPHPFGFNPTGIGQGQALGRLVLDDRINNAINAVTISLRGSGVPGAIMNTLAGFAENNRKLIWGNNYYLKKGEFSYPYPVSPSGT